MATSTTPSSNPRSTSRTRLPSRPTTPLRPPSRTSLRASQTTPSGSASTEFPLASLEPAFAELSDSMADLEANFMHLQLLHESLGRFNENFGAFLYGLNMSAFCVDFPEAPVPQSFVRAREAQQSPGKATPGGGGAGVEETFLTNDTSFVENPPTSGRPSKFATPKAARERTTMGSQRGGLGTARGRGAGASGIARSTSTRGGAAAGASRGASGIGRGLPKGRGVGR